jgi:tellurite resistance protein TerC
MQSALPIWFELTSFAVLIVVLAGDLVLAYRRPHIPSKREAAAWIAFYVALSGLFALAFVLIGRPDSSGQFLAGWLTEYSLSIDNLFVFFIIMAKFSVPRKSQQSVLMVGIVIALVLRGIFIVVGAQLVTNFTWVFYLFGAFMLYSAVMQARETKAEETEYESRIVRFLRRRIRISSHLDGTKIRSVVDGKKMFTPLLLIFLAIGATDLVFAFDSIPAIFGITQDPFIVFTANVCALMGLRQLYFLLGHLLDKLEYLKYGVAAILGFIGAKLVLHALRENNLPFINGGDAVEWSPEISTPISLAVIIGAMAVATIASLIHLRAVGRSESTG